MKHAIQCCALVLFFTAGSAAQISATFSGDTTKIWDTYFSWGCAGTFFPVTSTSNDTIYLTECDTMDLATCTCHYTVCTSFIGLSAGSYTAVVTRQWKYRLHSTIDTVLNYTEAAGSVAFTVLNQPTLSSSVAFYQSGCLSVGVTTPDQNTTPDQFFMLTNYPNPFNPSTTIRYTIPRQSHVALQVFNALGQLVAVLLDRTQPAGTYEAIFSGTNLASGIYLCRLSTGNKTLSKKILLLK